MIFEYCEAATHPTRERSRLIALAMLNLGGHRPVLPNRQ